MAQINVERKKSPWPWIIGVLVLLLLVWGLMELLGDRDAEPAGTAAVVTDPLIQEPRGDIAATSAPASESVIAVTPVPMPPPPTSADAEPVPVAVIVVGPAQFLGQAVRGTARVAEVPSDRGFWLEQDGQRMFALIAQSPDMEDAVNIDPGQEVRLAGVVYDASMRDQIVQGELDAETQQIISEQPAFLLVDARNVQIVESAAGS